MDQGETVAKLTALLGSFFFVQSGNLALMSFQSSTSEQSLNPWLGLPLAVLSLWLGYISCLKAPKHTNYSTLANITQLKQEQDGKGSGVTTTAFPLTASSLVFYCKERHNNTLKTDKTMLNGTSQQTDTHPILTATIMTTTQQTYVQHPQYAKQRHLYTTEQIIDMFLVRSAKYLAITVHTGRC